MKNIQKYLDLSSNQRILFIHGIKILLNDFINIFSVIIVAYLLNDLIDGIIYNFLFTQIRLYSGGYHAKTKYACSLLYIVLYVIYQTIKESIFLNVYFNFPLVLLSLLIILIYSPMQHIFNPLSYNEYIQNRNKARILGFTLIAIYIIDIFFLKVIYKTISIILIYDSLLILFNTKSKYYLKEVPNDSKSSFNR